MENPPHDHIRFWQWFEENQERFASELRRNKVYMSARFDEITFILRGLDTAFTAYCLVLPDTAILIISADGNVTKFGLAERLVAQAPEVKGWHFIALNPLWSLEGQVLVMGGNEYSESNIGFRFVPSLTHPDDTEVCFYYDDCDDINQDTYITGTLEYIRFNFGERLLTTIIDYTDVRSSSQATGPVRPLSELQPFLAARERELESRYRDEVYFPGDAVYETVSREDSGMQLTTIINTHLLEWESKPAYPWILVLSVLLQEKNDPDQEQVLEMIRANLATEHDCLHIAERINETQRRIYYACRGYSAPVLAVYDLLNTFPSVTGISYDISKDKYWRVLD